MIGRSSILSFLGTESSSLSSTLDEDTSTFAAPSFKRLGIDKSSSSPLFQNEMTLGSALGDTTRTCLDLGLFLSTSFASATISCKVRGFSVDDSSIGAAGASVSVSSMTGFFSPVISPAAVLGAGDTPPDDAIAFGSVLTSAMATSASFRFGITSGLASGASGPSMGGRKDSFGGEATW